MYAKEGKPAPAGMTTSVYYNRGILNAALLVEAVRLALTLTGGKPPTGADVKKGFDMIKNFSLGGLVPPLEITSADHEGGGWMQVYEVKGDKPVKDGYLSGGEREMLAIGRALISEPRILLLDEPSLSLAPLIVEDIFRIIRRLKEGMYRTILLVEQNAALALEIADQPYVMETGRIVLEGPAAELRENPEVKESYLGVNEVGARRSYRAVKPARRRQRWLARISWLETAGLGDWRCRWKSIGDNQRPMLWRETPST